MKRTVLMAALTLSIGLQSVVAADGAVSTSTTGSNPQPVKDLKVSGTTGASPQPISGVVKAPPSQPLPVIGTQKPSAR
jgi:hypothetical protein